MILIGRFGGKEFIYEKYNLRITASFVVLIVQKVNTLMTILILQMRFYINQKIVEEIKL